MKYKFNQALQLGKKDYPQGVHELSESAECDPHFLGYVGCGYVEEAPEGDSVSSDDVKIRQKNLVDRLTAKKSPEKKPDNPIDDFNSKTEVKFGKNDSEQVEEAKSKKKKKE